MEYPESLLVLTSSNHSMKNARKEKSEDVPVNHSHVMDKKPICRHTFNFFSVNERL